MKYYAMVDSECVEFLGDCEDFSDADERAPGNTHWIFNEEALRNFIINAQDVLKKEV
jgi:hypothetical protein